MNGAGNVYSLKGAKNQEERTRVQRGRENRDSRKEKRASCTSVKLISSTAVVVLISFDVMRRLLKNNKRTDSESKRVQNQEGRLRLHTDHEDKRETSSHTALG